MTDEAAAPAVLKAPPAAPEAVINGRFLAKPPTGVTRVGTELLRAILLELAAHPGAGIRLALPIGADIPGAPPARLHLAPGWGGNLGEQILLPLRYPGATILSFCNSTPLLAARAIVWIHDSHVFDGADAFSRPYRLWHKSIFAVARARRFQIVTVSEHSRQRLIAHGADPARIETIYNGGDHLQHISPDDSAARDAGLLDGRFILIVGSRAKHKNVPFAVDALSTRLPQDIKIAIVGMGQEGPYGAAAQDLNSARVIQLPRISDAQLRALYQHTLCAVTPSLLEGFGLPASEALWEGAPQALSDRGSLPEVGGEAATYFDARNAEQMASAVMDAIARKDELRAKALIQREKFQWRFAARRALELAALG